MYFFNLSFMTVMWSTEIVTPSTQMRKLICRVAKNFAKVSFTQKSNNTEHIMPRSWVTNPWLPYQMQSVLIAVFRDLFEACLFFVSVSWVAWQKCVFTVQKFENRSLRFSNDAWGCPQQTDSKNALCSKFYQNIQGISTLRSFPDDFYPHYILTVGISSIWNLSSDI